MINDTEHCAIIQRFEDLWEQKEMIRKGKESRLKKTIRQHFARKN